MSEPRLVTGKQAAAIERRSRMGTLGEEWLVLDLLYTRAKLIEALEFCVGDGGTYTSQSSAARSLLAELHNTEGKTV